MEVNSWPSDEEAAEKCICGHMLGQHEYGAYRAGCDFRSNCPCWDFEPMHGYIDAKWVAQESVRRRNETR